MLGTAAQITTFACISLRAYIGRQLPTGLEVRDYALAAAGLLNFRGALVSCFAGLLFLLVSVSFVRARCRTAGFHSIRGTTYYNIWKLVYERIEKSSTGEVLRFLVRNCGFLALAVAKVPHPGAGTAGKEQARPLETQANFPVSPCPDPVHDTRPSWAAVAQGASEPLRAPQTLAAKAYLSPREISLVRFVSDHCAAASRSSRPNVAPDPTEPSTLGPASPALANNPYLPSESITATSSSTVGGSAAATGAEATTAASGGQTPALPCATLLSDVGIEIRPQPQPLLEEAFPVSSSSVANPGQPREKMATIYRIPAASRSSRPYVAPDPTEPSTLGPASPALVNNPYLPSEGLTTTLSSTVVCSAATSGTEATEASSGGQTPAPPCATLLSDVGIAIQPQPLLLEAAFSASNSSVANPAPSSAALSLPSDVSVAIRPQEEDFSAVIVPARCHPFEPDAALQCSRGVRPSTPGSDNGNHGDETVINANIQCSSLAHARNEFGALLEPGTACEPAGGASDPFRLAAAQSLRRELGAERDALLARASVLAMSISALQVACANTKQGQNLSKKLEAERDDLRAQVSALEVAIAGIAQIGGT